MNRTNALTIKSKIRYKMTDRHPDFKEEYRGKVFEFEDTYYMDREYWDNDLGAMKDYIKNDLAIVAGGGYSTEGITDVEFEFSR